MSRIETKKRICPFVDEDAEKLRRYSTEDIIAELEFRRQYVIPTQETKLQNRWFSEVCSLLSKSGQEEIEKLDDSCVLAALKSWFEKNFTNFWTRVDRNLFADLPKCRYTDSRDDECETNVSDISYWSTLLLADEEYHLCDLHSAPFLSLQPEDFLELFDWHNILYDFRGFSPEIVESHFENEQLRSKALERASFDSEQIRCSVEKCRGFALASDLGISDLCYQCGRYCCPDCRDKANKEDLLMHPESVLRDSRVACCYTCGTCRKTFCRLCKPKFIKCHSVKDPEEKDSLVSHASNECNCGLDYCFDKACIPELDQSNQNPLTFPCPNHSDCNPSLHATPQSSTTEPSENLIK